MKRITEVSLVSIVDANPDFSCIGEYTDTPSDWVIVRREGEYLFNLEKYIKGEYNSFYELPEQGRERRFFKPYAGGEKEGTPEYQTYGKQDFERAESYARQNWCFTGIKAIAKVQTSSDGTYWLMNEVESGGLWGIESDCEESDKKEASKEQLEDLRDVLKAFGFTNKQIDKAFKDVKEKHL